MKRVLLVKYGEIALRKGNRALFERKLARTLQGLINDESVKVTREQGRLLIEDARGDINISNIEKIRRVFGITAICISQKTENKSIESLKKCALMVMGAINRPELAFHSASMLTHQAVSDVASAAASLTFKVETKRSDKTYPMDSRAVSATLGEYVLEQFPGLKVDVHKPDIVLWVEIRNSVYVYTEVIKCEAGLPYGSSGKGVLLLSGGIDSPVAGYLMARRGMEIVPVYFHSPPHTSERAREKVVDIMDKLRGFVGHTGFYVVRFTEVQMYIYENMQMAKMTLFLKRAMLHISSMIAEKEKAHCLITGDSVGQVASQTAQSIAAVDSASEFTVLRPLAAMDKQQIINIAKEIDTYDISIRPYNDCCTVFVPKHPENKPNAKAVEKMESKHLILPELYARAAHEAEFIT